MDALVKFRMLYDSLDQAEKDTFFKKLMQSHGTDFIATAIFSHFSNMLLKFKKYDKSQVDTMNTSLSTIIHARDPEKAEKTEKTENEDSDIITACKLDGLSPPLIANISSYLPQNEHARFARMNRKIFVGCNSPFSLSSIRLPHHYEHPVPALPASKLQRVTEMKVNIQYLTQWVDASYCSNVRRLYLDTNAADASLLNKLMQLQNKGEMFAHVEYLKLSHLNVVSQPFFNAMGATIFMDFLSSFPNLKYLDIKKAVEIDCDDEWLKNIPLFPKLTGLNVNCEFDSRPFIKALVNKHADQIEVLDEVEVNLFKSDKTSIASLPNLKEMSLINKYSPSLWDTFSGSKHIEKLNVHWVEPNHIPPLVQKLLKEQPHLEYLQMVVLGEKKQWIEQLEKGFVELKTLNKKRFNVKLILDCRYEESIVHYVSLITPLVNLLNDANITNFSLQCRLIDRFMAEVTQEFVDKLKGFGDEYLVHHTSGHHTTDFVIANKKNLMEGGYKSIGLSSEY